jgi:hypothetical protein
MTSLLSIDFEEEVDAEDLEAASDYYQHLLDETLPQHQAAKLALDHYGILLSDKTLNSILGQFACTKSSLHTCVEGGLRREGLL